MKCTQEWIPGRSAFPSPADIGECCVPGDRFVVVQAGSRNITKTVPWTERLRMLAAPKQKRIEEKVPDLTPEQRKKNIAWMWELVEKTWPKGVKRGQNEPFTRPIANGESTMSDEQIAERKRFLNEQAEKLENGDAKSSS